MTIPTHLSLQGFIATEPQLSFGESGHARFYCWVGIEQHRKEADGGLPHDFRTRVLGFSGCFLGVVVEVEDLLRGVVPQP